MACSGRVSVVQTLFYITMIRPSCNLFTPKVAKASSDKNRKSSGHVPTIRTTRSILDISEERHFPGLRVRSTFNEKILHFWIFFHQFVERRRCDVLNDGSASKIKISIYAENISAGRVILGSFTLVIFFYKPSRLSHQSLLVSLRNL